jgi:hypothetical protein
VIRYERQRASELVHIDCKKLGRIIQPGERVTGDRTKRANGQTGLAAPLRRDRRRNTARPSPSYLMRHFGSAIGFLAASERFYARGGLETKRLMTDG